MKRKKISKAILRDSSNTNKWIVSESFLGGDPIKELEAGVSYVTDRSKLLERYPDQRFKILYAGSSVIVDPTDEAAAQTAIKKAAKAREREDRALEISEERKKKHDAIKAKNDAFVLPADHAYKPLPTGKSTRRKALKKAGLYDTLSQGVLTDGHSLIFISSVKKEKEKQKLIKLAGAIAYAPDCRGIVGGLKKINVECKPVACTYLKDKDRSGVFTAKPHVWLETDGKICRKVDQVKFEYLVRITGALKFFMNEDAEFSAIKFCNKNGATLAILMPVRC